MIDDRELSELVSTRVMGWSLRENGNREVGGTLYCDPLGCICTGFPSFATDAGLALEAAMKTAKGWAVEIQAIDPSDCRVQIRNLTANSWPTGRSRKLARALCLAALRAAGVEIQGDELEAAERQGE